MDIRVEDYRNLPSEEDTVGVKSVLFTVCYQISCYIIYRDKPFFFTEGVSVVYLDFLNLNIQCTGGY